MDKRHKIDLTTDKMQEQPLVTIITACFNRATTIEKAIQSVVNQTYSNIEYIVIDGGSTDGTVDVIKKYEDKIAYWISEPDKNVAEAFNKGIKAANGVLIGLINSDDWYETDAVETMVKEYLSASNPNETLFYGMLRLWKENKEYALRRFHHNFINETVIQHPTWFIAREYYLKMGLYDTSYRVACDFELLHRMNRAGVRFHNVDRVIVNYQLGSGHSFNVNSQMEYLDIKRKYQILSDEEYNEMKISLTPPKRNLKYFLKNIIPFYSFFARQYSKKIQQLNVKWRHLKLYLKYATSNKLKLLYLSTPTHTNGGDLAIAYATRKWLQENFKNVELIELHEAEIEKTIPVLKKITTKQDIIFLHGGGNLGDWYDLPEDIRRSIIQAFPNNKVLLFPQSVYFSDTSRGRLRLKESQLIYSAHKNLKLLLRDEFSYKLAKDYFPANKVFCFPDMVFYCDPFPAKSNSRNGKVLLSLRYDIEQKLDSTDYLNIISIINNLGLEYSFQDTHLSNMRNDYIFRKSPIETDERSMVVPTLIQLFENYNLVITDRFHGVLFSYITNTPCIVLSSADHKIKEGLKWMKNANFVFWVGENYNEIADTIKIAMEVSPNKVIDFKKEYFDQLRDIVDI